MTEAMLEKIKTFELYKTVLVPIDYIRTAPYNPRTITPDHLDALKRSLVHDKMFLRARPIIVNTFEGREGIIIAGNQRYHAAQDLGWAQVPVMFVSVPEDVEKAWNIKDNVNQGSWDADAVRSILGELHSLGMDMSSIGLVPDELTSMMDAPGPMDPTNEDDTAGAPAAPAKRVECPACHHQFDVTKDAIVKPSK